MSDVMNSEFVRNTILFDLLQMKAGLEHWKHAFEVRFRIAAREDDRPIQKEDVREVARELTAAIQWFHGAAITLEIETLKARPARGEPAAYWFFDGYELIVGSTGYQGNPGKKYRSNDGEEEDVDEDEDVRENKENPEKCSCYEDCKCNPCDCESCSCGGEDCSCCCEECGGGEEEEGD